VVERSSRTVRALSAGGSVDDDSVAEAGTSSGGWRLADPAVEAAIVAFVATAPPLPEDTRARLARLLRTDQWMRDAA
jgi:hypothetical protein